MGYRNDVAIKCKPNAYKMFETILGKEIFPDKIYRHISNTHILVWEWDKWDEEDEEVQRVTDLMDELDKLGDKDDYGYAYLRLGEDDGDVETRSNTDELKIYVTRSIYISDSYEEVEVND